ncbi:MAG: rRNA pseudouridine synthase [Candidatus Buchananbacteria bacterium]|nr:rRNA pseudouridine synthase [Candidatus Buchananbacteria bacterium]
MMRLQKFLANAGIASRRKAEELILAGKIKVNGQAVKKLGISVDEVNDQIEFNNKPVKLSTTKVYFALYKPVGYISSTTDSQGKSVVNLVKTKEKIYPVGQLDKDSSGLILLTNDGEFTNQITHAKYGCQKEYFAVLDQDLRPADIKKIERGMILASKKLQPAEIVSAQNKSVTIILSEGVNRQIRRMFGQLGYTILKLKRVKIGKLELGDLQPGNYKKIKPSDVI